MNLPPKVEELVNSCPRHPHGVHKWLFRAARYLHPHMTDGEIHALLEARTKNCGRFVPGREIECAIRNSAGTASSYHYLNAPRPAPSFDAQALAKVAARLPEAGPDYLYQRSPIDPRTCTTHQFLCTVFRPGEHALIISDYYTQGQLVWAYPDPNKPDLSRVKLRQFRHGCEKGVWFVSNPVDGEYHLNPRQNCQSRRSEESITDFRHMILESDVADERSWIAYLCQITLPVIAIYSTGGRAPHALVQIDAGSKENWDQIKYGLVWPLVRFGACDGSLSAVRLTRLPGCRREEKQSWQTLLYLNPDPLRKQISDMEEQR